MKIIRLIGLAVVLVLVPCAARAQGTPAAKESEPLAALWNTGNRVARPVGFRLHKSPLVSQWPKVLDSAMLIVVTPTMAIASVTICFRFIGVVFSRILEQLIGTALQFAFVSSPPFHAHKNPSC